MSWISQEEAGLAVRLALPFIDVLIGNQLELMLVSGERDLDSAVAKLRKAGIPLLVSKLGEQERASGRREPVFLPPYSVEVCTTIGPVTGSPRASSMPCSRTSQLSNAFTMETPTPPSSSAAELFGSHADSRRGGRDDPTARP